MKNEAFVSLHFCEITRNVFYVFISVQTMKISNDRKFLEKHMKRYYDF